MVDETSFIATVRISFTLWNWVSVYALAKTWASWILTGCSQVTSNNICSVWSWCLSGATFILDKKLPQQEVQHVFMPDACADTPPPVCTIKMSTMGNSTIAPRHWRECERCTCPFIYLLILLPTRVEMTITIIYRMKHEEICQPRITAVIYKKKVMH